MKTIWRCAAMEWGPVAHRPAGSNLAEKLMALIRIHLNLLEGRLKESGVMRMAGALALTFCCPEKLTHDQI
jgi:hypothetical protein